MITMMSSSNINQVKDIFNPKQFIEQLIKIEFYKTAEVYINDVKDQIQNYLNISLFPNPVSGILSIHNAPENLISVSIVSVLGEQMIVMASPKAADFVIDLSKVLPGTYFARFTMSDKIINIKLLKL